MGRHCPLMELHARQQEQRARCSASAAVAHPVRIVERFTRLLIVTLSVKYLYR